MPYHLCWYPEVLWNRFPWPAAVAAWNAALSNVDSKFVWPLNWICAWRALQDTLRYEENPIPDHYRSCPADELFGYMADTLIAFAAANGWCDSMMRRLAMLHARDALVVTSPGHTAKLC